MEPRTGIASPQGDSQPFNEVLGGGGWIRWTSPLAQSSANRVDVEMVSLASPPRVSATRGIKSTPAERHSERWLVNFRRTPTSRVCPGLKVASATVCCWSGEMT